MFQAGTNLCQDQGNLKSAMLSIAQATEMHYGTQRRTKNQKPGPQRSGKEEVEKYT